MNLGLPASESTGSSQQVESVAKQDTLVSGTARRLGCLFAELLCEKKKKLAHAGQKSSSRPSIYNSTGEVCCLRSAVGTLRRGFDSRPGWTLTGSAQPHESTPPQVALVAVPHPLPDDIPSGGQFDHPETHQGMRASFKMVQIPRGWLLFRADRPAHPWGEVHRRRGRGQPA